MVNKKALSLGTKLPYLGIFGPEFVKTIVIFEITLEFIYSFFTNTVNFGIGFTFF